MIKSRVLGVALMLSRVGCAQTRQRRNEPSSVDVVTIVTSIRTTICPVASYVDSSGRTVVSSGSIIIIDKTDTITVPSVTSGTISTTDGTTLTSSPLTPTPLTTVINGKTVVSSTGGAVIGGSDTVAFPTVSSQSAITTDGITFTLLPPTPNRPSDSPVTTILDGKTVISSADGAIIGGTNTIVFPPVSSQSELTTDGITFTLHPSMAEGTTEANSATIITNGQTTVSSLGGVITGTDTPISQRPSSQSVQLTDGTTFTPFPSPVEGSSQGSSVTTTINGHVIVSSLGGVIIDGTDILEFPSVTSQSELLTMGLTFTLFPSPTNGPTAILTGMTTGPDGIPTPASLIPSPITVTTTTTGNDGLVITNIITTVIETQSGTGNTDALTITDFPGFSFVVPTKTLLTGPEETLHAVDTVPILLWLYENADLISDNRYRLDFIRIIKQSRDDILGLFNSFTDKPDPKPECNKTSVKRDLFSDIVGGIASVVKGAVDLVSCAVGVLNNLADMTEDIGNLPIDGIKMLTDTLGSIANEIERISDDPTASSSRGSETETSTRSSTSSCTTSLTVTWESVFCTITTTAGQNQRRDGGCSTTAYSTITDCDATPSTATATVTTTVSPVLVPSEICALGACTNASCVVESRDILGARSVSRNTEPLKCKWAEKSNYANPENFMANEVHLAYENGDSVPLAATVGSKLVSFGDQPISIAVQGLYGCTSIIAVSHKGAWASHLFEVPLFYPYWQNLPVLDDDNHSIYDDDTGEPIVELWWMNPMTGQYQRQLPVQDQLTKFRRDGLGPLASASGTYNRYALKECRNNPASEFRSWQGHLFDDAANTKIFIFAPYERLMNEDDPNYGNEFPTGLKLMWDDEEPTTHYVRPDRGYPGSVSYNQQIRTEIASYFGGDVDIKMAPYAPRLGVSVDALKDEQFDSNRGKVLVQYQPAVRSNGTSLASWRIWFEGHDDTMKTSSWTPNPANGSLASGGRVEQICADLCELPGCFPSSSLPAAPASTEKPSSGAVKPSSSAATTVPAKTSAAPDPPAETPTVTPIDLKTEVDCWEESDHPGHPDYSEVALKYWVGDFCSDDPKMTTLYSDPQKDQLYTETEGGTKSPGDIARYIMKVEWVKDCQTSQDWQSIQYPTDPNGQTGETCDDILERTFSSCKLPPPLRFIVSWKRANQY